MPIKSLHLPIMKKLFCFTLLCFAILLSGCDNKEVTNQYSIGCMTYKGNLVFSDWNGFESYISSQVDYNVIISFTSKTREENDLKAIQYFNEQVTKLDTDSLCTFIAPGDYIVYGVGYSIDEHSFYILKGLTFGNEGVTDYDEHFAVN